jgi:hypothetical protein
VSGMSRELGLVAVGSLLTALVIPATAYVLSQVAGTAESSSVDDEAANGDIGLSLSPLTPSPAPGPAQQAEMPRSSQQVQAPNADEAHGQPIFEWDSMGVLDVLRHINQKDALSLSGEMLEVCCVCVCSMGVYCVYTNQKDALSGDMLEVCVYFVCV